MATIKINGRVYVLTASEREALNTETTLQAAADAGEFPNEGAAELYKMWFDI